tara:strand:+ start:517 stop:1047 length:531 start_codon:yes stop_codon:yes gene_type:complete
MSNIKDHNDFIKYQNYIISHENFKDLPDKRNNSGEITWVKTKKSSPDRANWWDKKINIMNLNSRSEVARSIHPKELKGLKPCSVCGKKLSIFYVYPNKILLKKINRFSNQKFLSYDKTINQIIDNLVFENSNNIQFIINIFKIKDKINNAVELKNHLKTKFIDPRYYIHSVLFIIS